MTPPELRIPGMNIINGQSDKIECSPEKVHAYMLGKNIYQYLTQTQLREFFIPNAQGKKNNLCQVKDNGSTLDFSNPIFSSPAGQAYRSLIESLVCEEPEKRISLAQAQTMLDKIQQMEMNPADLLPQAQIRQEEDQEQTLVNTLINDADQTVVNENEMDILIEECIGALKILGTYQRETDSNLKNFIDNTTKVLDNYRDKCELLQVEKIRVDIYKYVEVMQRVESTASKKLQDKVRALPLEKRENILSMPEKQSLTASFKKQLSDIKEKLVKILTEKNQPDPPDITPKM